MPERLERLSFVRKPRRGDRSVADRIGAGELLVDHDAERVALLQGEEVDVPLEDVYELLDERRTLARAAHGVVERGVDVRGDYRVDATELGGAAGDVEARRRAHRVDLAPAGDLHL